jgi:hypothetical protein
MAGGKLSAALNCAFSSSSSATRLSSALNMNMRFQIDRKGVDRTDLEMGSSASTKGALDIASTIRRQVVVTFSATFSG